MRNINIFVGNSSLEMTADELREYGFVEMDSKSEGAVAIASLKGKTIRGRVIKVVEALPLADNNDKGFLHSRRSRRIGGFSGRGRQRRY